MKIKVKQKLKNQELTKQLNFLAKIFGQQFSLAYF
jgi:hypothetical protein